MTAGLAPATLRLEGLRRADFDALSFDVYGTILDWEPEIVRFLDRFLLREGSPLRGRDLLLSYDRLRQPLQARRPALPYPEVLRETLAALAAETGVTARPGDLEEFAGIAATHHPFPDSVAALAEFRGMGLTLAALSKIDEASLARAMQAVGIRFDVVVTAERVGAYKPDLPHFRTALDDLAQRGIPASRVLHVAQSRRADIVPANALGLTCVWINRPGHVFGRSGAETAHPDYEAPSLAALAGHLAAT